jgi:DUF4097 and DUF4098 domain-containing protein YvlB
MKHENNRLKNAQCIALLTALLIAPLANAEVVEKRLAADPRGEVDINNVAGTVRVTAWDKAEVEVKADLGANVERLEFEREGDRTKIKVVLPRFGNSGGSDLDIRVPRDSRVSINTVSAEQSVAGVRGSLRLQSVSGRIDSQSFGELELKTVSGEVSVKGGPDQKNGASRTRITTVSGDVELSGLAGEIDANSVSGNIEASVAALSRARFKSTNGDMSIESTLERDAVVEAETINGDVSFKLREPLNAEFDIETFNGDVESCFGQKPRRTREHGPGQELRFKQGEGSARVRIKTLNGDVEICGK